jgi:quercetin dioxygenase-like cupin family protein
MMKQEFHIQAIELATKTAMLDRRQFLADPSHTSGSYVTFEPGARSAWHTHPLGQTLIVTAGTGWLDVLSFSGTERFRWKAFTNSGRVLLVWPAGKATEVYGR